ncbi:MAG: thioredoxin family protein [Rhizobiaceae bacterium]|nr:thioredoxin family protein [Rhizobiaceae bacterium]
MRLRFLVSLLAGIALASSLHAQELAKIKGVVELFTSQGCASCPPADEALQKLINQGDVVALAYHVDYWNYLGWNDTLASKDNTARQYAYARMLGRSGVYTPQAIINGRDHMNGADLSAINVKLDDFQRSGKGLSVPVDAAMKGDELEIKIGAGQGKANVVVVYFDREQVVSPKAGENNGQQIAYVHAVSDVETVGMWDGKAMNVVLPANVMDQAGRKGLAVLLQSSTPSGDPAAIIGATVLTMGSDG